ncbi:MAG: hypothetical protein K8T26_09465 [Lentisphaerae bacterium]|nr:hypothetical protein [Lentisphaerota bacterium]
MLTCKQVSRALERGDYAKLPPLSRLALRLHVAMCVVCGGYNRQVMAFYDAVRAFLKAEDADLGNARVRLPDATRVRLKETLRGTSPGR